ncbi:MAG: diphosphate--fructose-6-phosphate 1-phosphotransferase [Gemmataceae bacterium]
MGTAKDGGTLALVVGGGPAPGINGVISAVTIEAINHGMKVLGVQDGYKWLVEGKTDHIRDLSIADVSRLQLTGGSILGTSRTNPAKKDEDMNRVLDAFRALGVTALVSIGGDDTAFSASQVYKRAGGAIHVAHVPKTIDNDLPLPPSVPTFGFETARHHGVFIVRSLAEDAKTTGRWYIIVSMGRAAGHLALGIGKAAAATLTLIPEEFVGRSLTLDELVDTIAGTVLKRKASGKSYGIVVLAEGLIESIGEKGLAALGDKLERYGSLERDPHGHLRLGEIEFGRMVKDRLAATLDEMKIKTTLIDKDLGYELRCAEPIPFDAEYTRDLGYGAVKFLLSPAASEFGAVISFVDGKMVPQPFEKMINPATGRMLPRKVDVKSETFECARRYMIRLEPHDFEGTALERYAAAAGMTPAKFKERFGYLAQQQHAVGGRR